MVKESRIIPILSYIYIVLPILIFIIGWCKPLIGILGTLIILVSLYMVCKNAPKLWLPKDAKGMLFLLGLFVISLVWVYYSGIGALVYQNFDHTCRNPIFELLVNNSWPVIVQDEAYLGVDKPLMLTYYIAFWLPPAVIGKLFHSIQIGYYAQVLWATIGIFFTFYYIMTFLKNKTYLPIFIFIFFSGLDVAGASITRNANIYDITSHLEWWFFIKQFSSFTTQLFWVFNQAIPAWLLTLMFLKEKNNGNILFCYSALLLYSTLPAIGILPLVVYLMFLNGKELSKNSFKVQNLKECLKNACTIQNTLGTAIITIVSYSYLSNNLSGGNFTIWNPNILLIILYILFFLFLEVGIFILIIFNHYKKEPLLYMISLMFIIYPFLGIGSHYDFCMRGTIPALIILYLLTIKIIDNGQIFKNKFIACCLVASLIIGAITPIHEFARTIHYTNLGYRKTYSDLRGSNFFAYVDGNTFLKYFGKVTDK